MSILVTGSIAYDLCLGFDGRFSDALVGQDVQRLSVGWIVRRFARHFGGTGANIAWNLRLLRQDPLLAASLGEDGTSYIAVLKERGIQTDFIEIVPRSVTATAMIATDSNERQITFYHPGADALGSWPDLSLKCSDISWAVVAPRDARVCLLALDWCAGNNVPVLFDPGQGISGFSDDDLRRALRKSSGLIVNHAEWDLLSTRLSCTAADVLSWIPFLVITRGEEGFTLYEQKESRSFPVCIADVVVNPTGAGDAFRAGLLTGLSQCWSLAQSCQLGAALGSFVVEQEGALLDRISLDAVWRRAAKAYGQDLPSLCDRENVIVS